MSREDTIKLLAQAEERHHLKTSRAVHGSLPVHFGLKGLKTAFREPQTTSDGPE